MTARKCASLFPAITRESCFYRIGGPCSGRRGRLADMLATASNQWTESSSAWARGSWLTIATGFVAATTIFGCSAQRALEVQRPSAPPFQSSSPAHPQGRLEVASWYGPGFVGHLTSDGEIYNPKELTAASKTLPLGSRVRVTNPNNGRSVVVRINDRGPYVSGRSLDLSHHAAQEIGLCAEGVGRVRVRVLRHDAPIHGQTTPEGYRLQRRVAPLHSARRI